MRFRRTTRVVMVLAAVGMVAIAACGLDLVATGTDRTGGPDATTNDVVNLPEAGDGSTLDDGSQIDLPPLPDPFLDSGLDASQANCLAGCDGGGCDAGWCVFDCKASNSCSNRVVCPPGIPCEVQCGDNGCQKGVDCLGASACRVGCTGATACANGAINCSGAACEVTCSGATSCNQGVTCDAGACSLGCTGTSSCRNNPITCNADTCTVRCGVTLDNGKDACNQGVQCNATTSCDIGCPAHDTCKNKPIVATSPGTAIVACTGQGTCNNGTAVSGGDAGVLCGFAGACATKNFCDAGKCTASCTNNDNFTFCCKAGAGGCTSKQVAGCAINAAGCP